MDIIDKIGDSILLYQGDCLKEMNEIPDASADLILTDPPYGTTACKWDSVIPFDLMWKQLHRIAKRNAAIVLFGSEPFSSALRMSNIKRYKYDWVWRKERGVGFQVAKYRPMMEHENVIVFCDKSPNYYPIMIPLDKPKREKYAATKSGSSPIAHINEGSRIVTARYPKSVLEYARDNANKMHPTQKPVALLEYLIRTYTNEGDTVLDFTMGSGSTGVACVNTNRQFVGIELDESYYGISQKRIMEAASAQRTLLQDCV